MKIIVSHVQPILPSKYILAAGGAYKQTSADNPILFFPQEQEMGREEKLAALPPLPLPFPFPEYTRERGQGNMEVYAETLIILSQ